MDLLAAAIALAIVFAILLWQVVVAPILIVTVLMIYYLACCLAGGAILWFIWQSLLQVHYVFYRLGRHLTERVFKAKAAA